MTYRRMPLWAFIAVIVSTMLVNFAVSTYVVRLSEKKWCELVTTLTAPGSPAPDNERGRRVLADIQDLRHKFHCS